MGGFILAAVVAAGCGPSGDGPSEKGPDAPAAVRVRVEQVQMGSPFVFTCYAASEAAAKNACRAAGRRVKQISARLSDYHDASELNRLCDSSIPGEPADVSADLGRVLHAAAGASRASGGAFDVTVGPLVKRWRQVRRGRPAPDAEELAALKRSVGWAAVRVSEEEGRWTVTFDRPGVRLDLGGIAKGYAADEAARVLRDHGVSSFLIDAGGDLLAGDPPPGRDGWTVGLPDPADADAAPTQFLSLKHAAVATSGDAYQFLLIDGVRYSHIVDPRTGVGLTDRSTVTVLAPTAMRADALASAVSVLGPADGIALLDRTPDAAGRVTTEAGVTESAGFADRLVAEGREESEANGVPGAMGGPNGGG